MIGFLDKRFFGFLLAGAVNTAFGYAAYGVLVLLGLIPQVAVVGSTILGILFNFVSAGTVFGTRSLTHLPRFLLAYGAILVANVLVLDLLLRAGVGPFLGQGIAVCALVPLNFLLMRRFVFNGRLESAQ